LNEKGVDMAEFDTLGGVYERSAADLPFREHLEHYSMRRMIGDITGLRVLDLGCGTGVYTRRYAEWGAARVVGIDVSEGMLATARACEPTPPAHDPQPQRRVEYLARDAAHPNEDVEGVLDGQFDLVASVYVLCYASSVDELAGMFRTARRALSPVGGRLVAATLNPDHGRGEPYYAGYGFTLSQHDEGEGALVTLNATLPDGEEFSVTARWWSRGVYQKAACDAGFTTLSWTHPTVSERGMSEYGRDYWAAYLAAPQAVILHAAI
jgi:SAM-dependent methyltransferase